MKNGITIFSVQTIRFNQIRMLSNLYFIVPNKGQSVLNSSFLSILRPRAIKDLDEQNVRLFRDIFSNLLSYIFVFRLVLGRQNSYFRTKLEFSFFKTYYLSIGQKKVSYVFIASK